MRARFGEEDDEDDEYAGGDGMGRRGRQRGFVGGGGFWRGEGRREAERQRAEAEARQVQDQSASVRREAGETDEARLEREFEEADRARQLLGMGIQGSVGRAGEGEGEGFWRLRLHRRGLRGTLLPRSCIRLRRWCVGVSVSGRVRECIPEMVRWRSCACSCVSACVCARRNGSTCAWASDSACTPGDAVRARTVRADVTLRTLRAEPT